MSHPRSKTRRIGRRESGVAAIELAFLMPILLIVLAPLILVARYTWHYTVAQKAAQDAARYLSTVTPAEIRSSKLAPEVAKIANKIATRELEEMSPGSYGPTVQVFCGTLACVGLGARPMPTTVRVVVTMDVYDTFFNTFTGYYGMPITADITMRYGGK